MREQVNFEKQFLRLWSSQVVSSLGSAVSSFALMLWLFERTKSGATLGFLMFAYLGPQIYLSLFAGHLIDRYPRKRVLELSDGGQLVMSLALLALLALSEAPPVWAVILLVGLSGVFSAVQSLIFLTSTALFIPKEKILKYNGIIQIFQGLPAIAAPLLALPLLQWTGIQLVVAADALSFMIAITILLTVRFPELKAATRPGFSGRNFLEAFRHIRANARLSSSLAFFAVTNFLAGLCAGLITAFIIEKTGEGSPWVAYNSSLTALGLVIGGVTLTSLSKNIRLPFLAIALAVFFSAVIGRFTVALAGATLVGLGLLFRNTLIPIINGSNDTIWQTEVPREIQGRIFGARRTVAQGLYPVGLLLGPLLLNTIPADWALHAWTGSPTATLFLAVGLAEAAAPLLLLRHLRG